MLVPVVLLFEILVLNNGLAEWVDMPQFSDGNKVYRIPTGKQDHFHKFAQKNMENQFFYPYQNITHERVTTEQIVTEQINGSVEHDSCEEDNIEEPVVQNNEENIFVTNKDEFEEATVPVMIKKQVENKHRLNETSKSNKAGLLEYLPVDILKSVHHTLMSQPASSGGKIQFLKSFENSLITEIESRLANTMIINRDKRGADHYDHNYDNEHAAGFPSIEGALMAISFLTFAVYLVRLVMLLFRNMNNNMQTTTGATLFLGRRKRSINNLDEDTAMILEKVRSFSSKF